MHRCAHFLRARILWKHRVKPFSDNLMAVPPSFFRQLEEVHVPIREAWSMVGVKYEHCCRRVVIQCLFACGKEGVVLRVVEYEVGKYDQVVSSLLSFRAICCGTKGI